MRRTFFFFLSATIGIGILPTLHAQSYSNWAVDLGFRFFKHSASGIPNEIQFNSVFARWENINQNTDDYTVSEYQALQPLYFNMNFGIDLFIRFNRHLLIKIGYDYSNPFGIGGRGNISYSEKTTARQYTETKEFSYTSHQINYFIGPIVPVGDIGAEIYLGFCMMPPTWVIYQERYTKVEDGEVVRNYDQTIPAPLGGHAGGDRLGHFSRIGLRRVEAHYGYSTKELYFFLFL